MTHREESLVAVLVSAEQLLRAADWPATRGQPSVAVPIGVLAALAGACDVARGSEGDPPPLRGLCQSDPECFRLAALPTGTCHFHSPQATAVSARIVMRDPVFTGGTDE